MDLMSSYENSNCHGFRTAAGQITNTSTTCLLFTASLISLRRREALPPNCFMELHHTRCTNAMCRARDTWYIFFSPFFKYNSSSLVTLSSQPSEESSLNFMLLFLWKLELCLAFFKLFGKCIGLSSLSPSNHCGLKQEYNISQLKIIL